jgi:uncharacterized protein (TIGR02444 family)
MTNPFWEFSLAFYAEPGVAPACLAMQDRDGLDVNLALLCCWVGVALDAAALAEAEALVRDWRAQVVQPLRAVRRWLKGRDEALRAQVAAQELAAEQRQQAMLYGWAVARWPEAGAQPGKNAAANLALLTAAPEASALASSACAFRGRP